MKVSHFYRSGPGYVVLRPLGRSLTPRLVLPDERMYCNWAPGHAKGSRAPERWSENLESVRRQDARRVCCLELVHHALEHHLYRDPRKYDSKQTYWNVWHGHDSLMQIEQECVCVCVCGVGHGAVENWYEIICDASGDQGNMFGVRSVQNHLVPRRLSVFV